MYLQQCFGNWLHEVIISPPVILTQLGLELLSQYGHKLRNTNCIHEVKHDITPETEHPADYCNCSEEVLVFPQFPAVHTHNVVGSSAHGFPNDEVALESCDLSDLIVPSSFLFILRLVFNKLSNNFSKTQKMTKRKGLERPGLCPQNIRVEISVLACSLNRISIFYYSLKVFFLNKTFSKILTELLPTTVHFQNKHIQNTIPQKLSRNDKV